MNLDLIIAMSEATGTVLTVLIIVLLVAIFGVIIFTDDTNWFD